MSATALAVEETMINCVTVGSNLAAGVADLMDATANLTSALVSCLVASRLCSRLWGWLYNWHCPNVVTHLNQLFNQIPINASGLEDWLMLCFYLIGINSES